MPLSHVLIEDLRCLRRVDVELGRGLNLIYGPNGSGKTSFLEGIFLLGRGRSFRTRNSEKLIARGAELLRVVGQLSGPVSQIIGVEVSKAGGTMARAGGSSLPSLAELSRLFPVQVLDPGLHRLVEDSAYRRRRWLDWGVFHVEHGFADHWMRYVRAIRQRNSALKCGDVSQVRAFDPEILRHGQELADARRRSIEALSPFWAASCGSLLGLDIRLSYHRGWASDLDLGDALTRALAKDLERGSTSVGPHRADIVLKHDQRAARDVLSRGQQKLVGAALTIAQLSYLKAEAQLNPTLLLDDPAAELDEAHLLALVALIRRLDCPMVVSSLSATAGALGEPEKVFHVEHGRVSSV